MCGLLLINSVLHPSICGVLSHSWSMGDHVHVFGASHWAVRDRSWGTRTWVNTFIRHTRSDCAWIHALRSISSNGKEWSVSFSHVHIFATGASQVASDPFQAFPAGRLPMKESINDFSGRRMLECPTGTNYQYSFSILDWCDCRPTKTLF